MTTEELARKYFCRLSSIGHCDFQNWRNLAHAARKFVKLENIRKAKERHEKFLRWCRKNPSLAPEDECIEHGINKTKQD